MYFVKSFAFLRMLLVFLISVIDRLVILTMDYLDKLTMQRKKMFYFKLIVLDSNQNLKQNICVCV